MGKFSAYFLVKANLLKRSELSPKLTSRPTGHFETAGSLMFAQDVPRQLHS